MWKLIHNDGSRDLAVKPDAGQAALFTRTSSTSENLGNSFISRPWTQVVLSWVCWFPLLMPLVWMSGLTLFWVLIVSFSWFVCWRRICDVEAAFALTAATLILGLVIGQIIGLPSDRAMSSIYHLIHWIILLAFMNIGVLLSSQSDIMGNDKLLEKLSKASLISLILLVLYLVGVALYVAINPGEIVFPTLVVGRLLGGLDMLSGFMTVTLAQVSPASAGAELRFLGYGLWTSEGAYIAVLFGLFTMMIAFRKLGWGGIVAVEVSVLLVVAMTGSRTTILAYILSMGLWALLLARYWRVALAVGLPLIAGGAVFFFAYGFDYLVSAFHQANEFRAASSGTRFASYRLAYEMTMDQNPVTGLGYTPEILEHILVPIGSHSSWTSILIRGGFVGVLAFLVVYILLARDLLRSWSYVFKASAHQASSRLLPDIVFSRAVFVTLLWWMTEDLDGPAAGVAFAGLAVGLFVGRQRSHAHHWDIGNQIPAHGAATPLRWR